MRKGIIYIHITPLGFYIGQTIKSLEERKQEHLKNAIDINHSSYNSKHYCAIRDPLWSLFEDEWKILEVADESKLNELEIMYIAKYDSYRDGLNSTLGGDGSRGFFHTEEFKNLLSKRMKESNPMKGKFGPEHNRYGSKHSHEWKEKQSIRMKISNPMRGLVSELHPRAKIGFEVANQIREEYKLGNITQNELAIKHKLGIRSIKDILANKRWSI